MRNIRINYLFTIDHHIIKNHYTLAQHDMREGRETKPTKPSTYLFMLNTFIDAVCDMMRFTVNGNASRFGSMSTSNLNSQHFQCHVKCINSWFATKTRGMDFGQDELS